MLTLLGDTHGADDHRLTGRTREAVRGAAHVCHLGDFTTRDVYDAIEAEAGSATDSGSSPLTAVAGNNEAAGLRETLPETVTVEYDGVTLALAHGHRRDRTALGLLAREADADIVAVGHSHRPGIDSLGGRVLVNPGSHAQPRRHEAAHAELVDGQVTVVTPDGETLSEVTL